MKKQTKATKESDIQRYWHVFDVKGKILGRISTEIAQKLIGKYKPYFVRHLDCGDNVVVINARYVKVTGKKEKQKMYGHYSGYPGGLKEKPLWKVREEKPEEIIRRAVLGMIPKNKLRNKIMTRLFIYAETDHPYKEKITQKNK